MEAWGIAAVVEAAESGGKARGLLQKRNLLNLQVRMPDQVGHDGIN